MNINQKKYPVHEYKSELSKFAIEVGERLAESMLREAENSPYESIYEFIGLTYEQRCQFDKIAKMISKVELSVEQETKLKEIVQINFKVKQ